MTARKQSPGIIAVQYVILALGLVFSVFPIYFILQASLRAGNSLYTTELQLLPANPTLENYRYDRR